MSGVSPVLPLAVNGRGVHINRERSRVSFWMSPDTFTPPRDSEESQGGEVENVEDFTPRLPEMLRGSAETLQHDKSRNDSSIHVPSREG